MSPIQPLHPEIPGRWTGIERPYGTDQVRRLRGSVRVEHTLAQLGARKLWAQVNGGGYVNALGAMTGGQAVQMAKAGLRAIYCSGWQAAADANLSGQTYPDQSLYPANSVPALVKRLNAALIRADQVECAEGAPSLDWLLPIVADAEAGFGGPLNAFELMKGMIEAGAAGVHFEDQLSSEKKCGHLGGKVLVPTSQFIRTLVSARLAADVLDVPTLIIARTDADSARLLTSDVDERDRPFLTGERTPEGFFHITGGVEMAIARAIAYAPYADLIWCETSHPDLEEARQFAEGVHARFPGKLLAYNCSPSFNWKAKLSDEQIAAFQRELGALGYVFQFVTLAGFHSLNHGMFELASAYRDQGMAAYSRLQQAEFASEPDGYTATRHQREVGTGYFDAVAETLGQASTLALKESTEAAQFAIGRAPAEIAEALDADHDQLRELLGRLQETTDRAALTETLEELTHALREHFLQEEHAKGLYGLLAARPRQHPSGIAGLVTEHKEILLDLGHLVALCRERPAPTQELVRVASEISQRLHDHERREMELFRAAGNETAA